MVKVRSNVILKVRVWGRARVGARVWVRVSVRVRVTHWARVRVGLGLRLGFG